MYLVCLSAFAVCHLAKPGEDEARFVPGGEGDHELHLGLKDDGGHLQETSTQHRHAADGLGDTQRYAQSITQSPHCGIDYSHTELCIMYMLYMYVLYIMLIMYTYVHV